MYAIYVQIALIKHMLHLAVLTVAHILANKIVIKNILAVSSEIQD